MLTSFFSASSLAVARIQLEPAVSPHSPSKSSWVREERPNPSLEFNLTVALKIDETQRAHLEKFFWEVSNPKHPKYGQYKTNAEIADLLAVPASRVERVERFFQTAGAAVTVHPHKDTLNIRGSVWAIEAALQTSLYWFRHSTVATAPRVLRAASTYSLPTDVAADVTMVGELLQFPRPRNSLRTADTPSTVEDASASWPTDCGASHCSKLVTPNVLEQRYKLTSSNGAAAGSNSMAVAEFQGQYYKPTDLSTFSSACGKTVEVATTIGGNQDSAGIEAELDIEYIKAVAPDVPLTVVYNSEYSLLNWCNQITGLDNSPLVHSVSYGNDEAQQTSTEYMYTSNTAFMKAGAKGLSILFASGDQGVCGREGCGFFKKKFHPDFPAASPYITAVGGTNFATESVIGAEEAWAEGGGGFSDTFGIPDYQASVVATYKASPDADLPPSSMWNATGRGYPDVAALGGQKNSYCVVTSGRFEGVAGTSASCPVVAGIFAKLNGLRVGANKAPLGFLNPFIYQNADAFQDVMLGTNNNGGSHGFKAIKGWDAATGLGTPDFAALSKAVTALP